MKYLAFQTLRSEPTGQEIELNAPTMRWAARHLAYTLKGTVSCTGTTVHVGKFTWHFSILS